MSLLPNFFSDPKLRARQDQLNAQWNSLRAVFQTCDNTPDSAFAEFATDFRLWGEFYDSETDWSANAANATNEWQAKAKEWADRLSAWGCSGNQDGNEILPSGIPGVKEPPPDSKNILEEAADAIGSPVKSFWDTLGTIGWVAVGILVMLTVGILYAVTHTKASTPYGSIG